MLVATASQRKHDRGSNRVRTDAQPHSLLANNAGLRTSMSTFRDSACVTDLNQDGQLVFTSSDIRPRLRFRTDVWDVLALSLRMCPCTLVWMIPLLLNSMKRINFFYTRTAKVCWLKILGSELLELHNSLNPVTFLESVDPRRLCPIKRIASKARCDSQGDAFYQSSMPLSDETLGRTLSLFLTDSKVDVSNKLAFFLRICTSEWPEAVAALE